jgi:predicted CXXCH cytochrome family protein
MAPGGRLELDGQPVDAEQPFPNVLHAKLPAGPGEHTVALIWEGGRQEVKVFVGDHPPEGFKPFRMHPPPAGLDCTKCHGMSRRGRFRFEGDCFTCHTDEQFTAKHPHPKHVLEQCGMCHNAHGSTADALQIYPRETACRQCHSL